MLGGEFGITFTTLKGFEIVSVFRYKFGKLSPSRFCLATRDVYTVQMTEKPLLRAERVPTFMAFEHNNYTGTP